MRLRRKHISYSESPTTKNPTISCLATTDTCSKISIAPRDKDVEIIYMRHNMPSKIGTSEFPLPSGHQNDFFMFLFITITEISQKTDDTKTHSKQINISSKQ